MELSNFQGILPGDEIEIWYYKDEVARNALCEEPIPGFDPDNLGNTHVLLGKIGGIRFKSPTTIKSTNEAIYSALQGENWSPNGEANWFIESKDLSHTSMSVGDIIVITKPERRVYKCASVGFELLSN